MALFLHDLSASFHSHGMAVGVAVSPGKPTWDLPSIVGAGIDKLWDFGTYAANDTLWKAKLNAALAAVHV